MTGDMIQAGMSFENTGADHKRRGCRRIHVIQVFPEDTWQAHLVALVRNVDTGRRSRLLCSTLANPARWVRVHDSTQKGQHE